MSLALHLYVGSILRPCLFSEIGWRRFIVRGLNKIVFVLMIVVSVRIVKLFLYKIIKKI